MKQQQMVLSSTSRPAAASHASASSTAAPFAVAGAAAQATTEATAETGAAQVIALSELEEPGAPAGARRGEPVFSSHPLHRVRTQLQVCIGSASLTVEELLTAREHQVLRLDRQVDQPVDLLLEGQVVARGALVAVDGHFGVRITELPIPLALGASGP